MGEPEEKVKPLCAVCGLRFQTMDELFGHVPLCNRIKELEGQVAVLEEKLRAMGEALHDE